MSGSPLDAAASTNEISDSFYQAEGLINLGLVNGYDSATFREADSVLEELLKIEAKIIKIGIAISSCVNTGTTQWSDW